MITLFPLLGILSLYPTGPKTEEIQPGVKFSVSLENVNISFSTFRILSVATPAEPRGEKTTFFVVLILGGEKLLN